LKCAVKHARTTQILDLRGACYGDFTTQAALSQALKLRMRGSLGWFKLLPHQKEALEMIQHKIARILNGDPNYADSWQDISGYAELVVQRLKGGANGKKQDTSR